jgi:hypothetical protein
VFEVLRSQVADVLFFCGQVKEPSYAAAPTGSNRRARGHRNVRIDAALTSKSGSRTSAFVGAGSQSVRFLWRLCARQLEARSAAMRTIGFAQTARTEGSPGANVVLRVIVMYLAPLDSLY